MTPFLFLLLSLVTYRLSMLISVEKGPARLLSKLRKLPPPKSSAREGLSCPYCVGMYVSALASLPAALYSQPGVLRQVAQIPVLDRLPEWAVFILLWSMLWLALAGASSFMVRIGRAPD